MQEIVLQPQNPAGRPLPLSGANLAFIVKPQVEQARRAIEAAKEQIEQQKSE